MVFGEVLHVILKLNSNFFPASQEAELMIFFFTRNELQNAIIFNRKCVRFFVLPTFLMWMKSQCTTKNYIAPDDFYFFHFHFSVLSIRVYVWAAINHTRYNRAGCSGDNAARRFHKILTIPISRFRSVFFPCFSRFVLAHLVTVENDIITIHQAINTYNKNQHMAAHVLSFYVADHKTKWNEICCREPSQLTLTHPDTCTLYARAKSRRRKTRKTKNSKT